MTTHGIQGYREKFAASAPALLAADPKFFKSFSDRYQAMTGGARQPHVADLRRMHNEMRDWSNEQLKRPDFNVIKDAQIWEGAQAMCDLIQVQIDNLKIADAALGVSSQTRGVQHSGWVNAVTGEPVRLLSPDESLSTRTGGSNGQASGDPSNGVGLGAILAGILNGPRTDVVRNALSEGTDSAGGFSVPSHVLEQFIDNLRAKTQFIRAGAKTLVLDTMKTSIVRVTSDPQAAWRAENAQVANGQPAFDAITFQPKSLAVIVPVSMELLQDSVNIEAVLERTLIGALSVALDQACLFGDGSANNPVGLYHTPGINTLSMGANGGELTSYDNFIDALYEIEAGNAGPATAAILNPRTIQSLRKMKDGYGRYLEPPSSLQDLKWLGTTSVPINQTQGTATGATSALVGDYTQAILGLRQELRLVRLTEALMGNLQVGFMAHLRADVAFAHPQSFTAIEGIIP